MKIFCLVTCLLLVMVSQARQTENNGMLMVNFGECTLVFDPEELVSFQNCQTSEMAHACTVLINKHYLSSWKVAGVFRIPETENNSTTTPESYFVCRTTCNRALLVNALRCRRQESQKVAPCLRGDLYYFTVLTRSSAKSPMKQDEILWNHTRPPNYRNDILIQAELCVNISTKLFAKNTPNDPTNIPSPSSVSSTTKLTPSKIVASTTPAKLSRLKSSFKSLTKNPKNTPSPTSVSSTTKLTPSKIVASTTPAKLSRSKRTPKKKSRSRYTFKSLKKNNKTNTPSPTSVSSMTKLTRLEQSGDTTQATTLSELKFNFLILLVLAVPLIFVIALLITIIKIRRKQHAHIRTENDYLTPADIVYSEYELSTAVNDDSVENEYLEITAGDLFVCHEVIDKDDHDMDYCGLIYYNTAGDYANYSAIRNASVPALNQPGNINYSESIIGKMDESATNDEHYSTIAYVEHTTVSEASSSTISDAPYSLISDSPYSNIAFIETATSHESSGVSRGVLEVRAAPGDTHYDHNICVTPK